VTASQAAGSDRSSFTYDTAPDRRTRILDLVRENGFCSASELSSILKVSEMTVRRDVRQLAGEGLVRVVHGGVSAITTVLGPVDFRLRATQQLDAKRAIARCAVDRIHSGTVIALDAGTTTLEVARQLPSDLRLTVVTHSLPAMAILAGRAATDVIGLGGNLHRETQAFAGPETIRSLSQIRVNTLLLAATAVRNSAMWCTNSFDAETKRALIASADRVILLVDSSKFETTALMRVAALDAIETVITDDGIEPDTQAALVRNGQDVVVVSVGESTGNRGGASQP
jgi:DeoR/GlpR family transcriptional regulator of sugar metabolism